MLSKQSVMTAEEAWSQDRSRLAGFNPSFSLGDTATQVGHKRSRNSSGFGGGIARFSVGGGLDEAQKARFAREAAHLPADDRVHLLSGFSPSSVGEYVVTSETPGHAVLEALMARCSLEDDDAPAAKRMRAAGSRPNMHPDVSMNFPGVTGGTSVPSGHFTDKTQESVHSHVPRGSRDIDPWRGHRDIEPTANRLLRDVYDVVSSGVEHLLWLREAQSFYTEVLAPWKVIYARTIRMTTIKFPTYSPTLVPEFTTPMQVGYHTDEETATLERYGIGHAFSHDAMDTREGQDLVANTMTQIASCINQDVKYQILEAYRDCEHVGKQWWVANDRYAADRTNTARRWRVDNFNIFGTARGWDLFDAAAAPIFARNQGYADTYLVTGEMIDSRRFQAENRLAYLAGEEAAAKNLREGPDSWTEFKGKRVYTVDHLTIDEEHRPHPLYNEMQLGEFHPMRDKSRTSAGRYGFDPLQRSPEVFDMDARGYTMLDVRDAVRHCHYWSGADERLSIDVVGVGGNDGLGARAYIEDNSDRMGAPGTNQRRLALSDLFAKETTDANGDVELRPLEFFGDVPMDGDRTYENPIDNRRSGHHGFPKDRCVANARAAIDRVSCEVYVDRKASAVPVWRDAKAAMDAADNAPVARITAWLEAYRTSLTNANAAAYFTDTDSYRSIGTVNDADAVGIPQSTDFFGAAIGQGFGGMPFGMCSWEGIAAMRDAYVGGTVDGASPNTKKAYRAMSDLYDIMVASFGGDGSAYRNSVFLDGRAATPWSARANAGDDARASPMSTLVENTLCGGRIAIGFGNTYTSLTVPIAKLGDVFAADQNNNTARWFGYYVDENNAVVQVADNNDITNLRDLVGIAADGSTTLATKLTMEVFGKDPAAVLDGRNASELRRRVRLTHGQTGNQVDLKYRMGRVGDRLFDTVIAGIPLTRGNLENALSGDSGINIPVGFFASRPMQRLQTIAVLLLARGAATAETFTNGGRTERSTDGKIMEDALATIYTLKAFVKKCVNVMYLPDAYVLNYYSGGGTTPYDIRRFSPENGQFAGADGGAQSGSVMYMMVPYDWLERGLTDEVMDVTGHFAVERLYEQQPLAEFGRDHYPTAPHYRSVWGLDEQTYDASLYEEWNFSFWQLWANREMYRGFTREYDIATGQWGGPSNTLSCRSHWKNMNGPNDFDRRLNREQTELVTSHTTVR